MEIVYTELFKRKLKKLSLEIQEQLFEKEDLFRIDWLHPRLRVHHLQGRLKGYYAFSVNYSTRVIFYIIDGVCYFYSIGDHDIYSL